MVCPYRIECEGHDITSWLYLPKMLNMEQIMMKYLPKLKGIIQNNWFLIFPCVMIMKKSRKHWELLQIEWN